MTPDKHLVAFYNQTVIDSLYHIANEFRFQVKSWQFIEDLVGPETLKHDQDINNFIIFAVLNVPVVYLSVQYRMAVFDPKKMWKTLFEANTILIVCQDAAVAQDTFMIKKRSEVLHVHFYSKEIDLEDLAQSPEASNMIQSIKKNTNMLAISRGRKDSDDHISILLQIDCVVLLMTFIRIPELFLIKLCYKLTLTTRKLLDNNWKKKLQVIWQYFNQKNNQQVNNEGCFANDTLINICLGPYTCSGCNQMPKSRLDNKKCARCKSVYYCSKECQASHWNEHKLVCK
jgi:hypothetical protein